MALFKILKGNLAGLPTKTIEGYMYITEDTGDIFVDIDTANTATIGENRIQLNADQATYIRKKVKNVDGTISTIDYDYITGISDNIANIIAEFGGLNLDYTRLKKEVLGPPNVDTGAYDWDNSRIDQLKAEMATVKGNITTINNTKIPELEEGLGDLEEALTKEIKDRQDGDKNLQDQIDIVNETLTAVSTTATNADENATDALSQIKTLSENQAEYLQDIQKAQNDAEEALGKADALTTRVTTAESSIQALVTKDEELNDKFESYLPLEGGTLTGSLIMKDEQAITIPTAPAAETHAANKKYVDTSIESAKNILTAAYQKDDEAINNTITGLNTKIGNNTTAISELTTKHNDDISNLTSKIDTEITNRSNADEAFQEAIDAIEKDIADLVAEDRALKTSHEAITVSLTGDINSIADAKIDSTNKINISTTLKNINGLTAGIYGPEDNEALNYGASFNVPSIKIDAQGRVIEASTMTVTLPAAIDLSDLEANIGGLQQVNNTQNDNINNLSTRMDNAETNIGKNTTAIENEVAARAKAVSDEVSARAAAVKEVADNLTAASTKHGAITVTLAGDITSSATKITSEDKIEISTELKDMTELSAGSYGPSADAAPASGAQFDVPSIEVDAKGRIVKASTKKVTMPSVKTIEDNIAGLDTRINSLEVGKLSNANPEVTTQTIEPSTNKKLTLNAVSEVTASGWTVTDTKTNYELDLSSFATNEELTAEITSLSNAMVFRGTLGVDGTITDLPTAGGAVWGDTYKVITAGTYAGKEAKVGDMFTCAKPVNEDYSWKLISSGDEPSGTVINVNTDYGITTADGNPITSSGTIIANLASYTRLGNVAADGKETVNRIYPVRLDKNGKLAVNVPWEDTDDNTIYYAGTGLELDGTVINHKNNIAAGTAQGDSNITLTFGGKLNIPSISYDTEGHITSAGTTTVAMPSIQNIEDALDDLRDADTGLNTKFNDYLPLTGGTLTNDLYIQLNGTSYKVYHEGYAPAGITIREW